MRIVRHKALGMFALAVVVLVTIVSCDSKEPPTTGTGTKPGAKNTSTAKIQEVRRTDGGTTFLRVDGWPIPSLGEAERKEFETSMSTADGRSVMVYRTVIDPLSLYTENPLSLIHIGEEKIQINNVKEYRTSAGVFCYRFQVIDAVVDEGTNKPRIRGALYSYSYYDEDGDGVFESLVISEKDRHGWKGFQNEPYLPNWTVAKIDERTRN